MNAIDLIEEAGFNMATVPALGPFTGRGSFGDVFRHPTRPRLSPGRSS